MKWLLVLSVLALAYAWWKHQRGLGKPPGPLSLKAQRPPQTLALIHCPVCGVSLPASEAVNGRLGSYCGVDHLHRAEH